MAFVGTYTRKLQRCGWVRFGTCQAVVSLMERGRADAKIASALKAIEQLEQNG